MSRLLRAGAVSGPATNLERSAKAERPQRAERSASAPSAPGAEPPAGARSRGFSFQDLPSGLASLVFHFSVLIILGLLVTEHTKPHLTEVIVDWHQGDDELAGGGGGTDGASTVESAMPDEDWTKTAADMAEAVPTGEALIADAPLTSDFGAVTADIAPSTGSSDALSAIAGMGESGLQGIGTGGGSGGGTGKGEGPGMGDGMGPGSETGVFGLRDEGTRIVYVFDRSESMNSVFTLTSKGQSKSITTLEAAKSELTKSVNELHDGSQFGMIFYNDEPMAFTDHYQVNGLSKVDARIKGIAQEFIYQLVAQRNTNHVDALEMALRMKPDVVFLITDGEEKDDPSSSEVRRLTGLAKRAGARINVINFCNEERPNSTLVSLANRTKGQFKAILIRSLIDPKW